MIDESMLGETRGADGAGVATCEPLPLVPIEALLRGRRTMRIVHRGEIYVLRITRNDRLILTK